MTLLALYPSKKNMKEHIGQRLNYEETSMFGPEYRSLLYVIGPISLD